MLLPDPLRNGYNTHHLRWSLSLGEEHPLTLGSMSLTNAGLLLC